MNTKKLKILGFVAGGIILINLVLAVILMVTVFKPKPLGWEHQLAITNIKIEQNPDYLAEAYVTGSIKNLGGDIEGLYLEFTLYSNNEQPAYSKIESENIKSRDSYLFRTTSPYWYAVANGTMTLDDINYKLTNVVLLTKNITVYRDIL